MALRHAVLASLLDGDASGYDLKKRMDISVGNFWHATASQIYAELSRLEGEGLIDATEVPQRRRPNKRTFALTDAGRAALAGYTRAPAAPTAIKDELLVKIQAADAGDLRAVAGAIDERRGHAEIRHAVFDSLLREFLRGRDEAAFLRDARRIGPYLNLRRARDFERENIAWYEWATAALRARSAATEGGGARAAEARR
jgi:DNA-binding PadR family transcriptional regulator